jgi:phosphatidylglycerol:prolipoprotein diacylglycerol transferase
VSDVDWAMVFPDPAAGPFPRHPSQLYEAATEGVLLFVILMILVRMGGLKRPGLVTGLFGIGYGVARILCEFFREPDPQLGFLFGGATMGMLLSLPLIIAGALFIIHAWRAREVQA